MFAGGTARLAINNGGEAPLELIIEPWADCYLIPPKQSWVVVTHAPAGDAPWTGTSYGDEPFEVDHRPDAVTVWPNGNCFHLGDRAGNAIDAADHQCPARDPLAVTGR
ncbi:hypothetical protein ACFWBN_03185 [Streptomyces sp. NPDC059989]|uniref:hypothetical protein n=1 Tax=Streptomyces sp. NPDC059989 TaxID=3347026 RepID=UPI0036BEECCE